MKFLLAYIPALGRAAMMAGCLVAMCGKRLFRRAVAEQSTEVAALEQGGSQETSGGPGSGAVLAELSALRAEVAELRRAGQPIQPAPVEGERAESPRG